MTHRTIYQLSQCIYNSRTRYNIEEIFSPNPHYLQSKVASARLLILCTTTQFGKKDNSEWPLIQTIFQLLGLRDLYNSTSKCRSLMLGRVTTTSKFCTANRIGEGKLYQHLDGWILSTSGNEMRTTESRHRTMRRIGKTKRDRVSCCIII